jgi:ATP-dependent exoDNAse (exonuclease V) alpha subunit
MDQELALGILRAGHNAFLTGAAGSGKTYTLNKLIGLARKSGKKIAVTATTGLAATHLSGNTIHSWSGLGIHDELHSRFFSKMPKTRAEQIKKSDILVIDEISMLHNFRLDLIDEICRTVRETAAPFGGLQVIFSGDFFQLPPVTRSSDEPRDSSPFAYNSRAWQDLDPAIIYLQEQYRQSDDEFLDILNKIRRDEVSRADAEKIAARFNAKLDGFDEITELHTTNRDVDAINSRKLEELDGGAIEYSMTSTGSANYVDRLKKSCLAPAELKLKKGALVMALKNNQERKFANGSIGTVVGFEKSFGNLPVVAFRNGRSVTVEPDEWELRDGDKKRASLYQIPLRLAYAITVHKSQGMTLDAAKINLKNVFEPGMGYVALSRVKSLDALSISGLSSKAFFVHPEVLDKDADFRKKSALAAKNLEHLRANAIKSQKLEQKSKKVKNSKKEVKPATDAEKALKSQIWSAKLAKMRKTYPNAYMPWSAEDDKKLLRLSGKSIKELTEMFGRHPGSITARLEKLLTPAEDQEA